MSAKAVEYLTRLLKEVKEFRRRNLDRVEALVAGLKQSLTEIGDLEDSFVMISRPSSPSENTTSNGPATLVLSTKSKTKSGKRDPWELTLPTVTSNNTGVLQMLHKVDEQFEKLALFLEELDGAVSQVFVDVNSGLPDETAGKQGGGQIKNKCPGCKEYNPGCAYYDFCDSLGSKPPSAIVRILHPDAGLEGLPIHPLISEATKKFPSFKDLPPVQEEDEEEDLPKLYGIPRKTNEENFVATDDLPALFWPTGDLAREDRAGSPDSLFGGSSLGSIAEEEEPEEDKSAIIPPPLRHHTPSPPAFYSPEPELEPQPAPETETASPASAFYLPEPASTPETVIAIEPATSHAPIKRRDSDRDSGLDVDMADQLAEAQRRGYWDMIDYGRETTDGYSSAAFNLNNYAQSQSIFSLGGSAEEDEAMSDNDEAVWSPSNQLLNEKFGLHGDIIDIPMEEDCGYDVVEGMEL